MGKILIEFDNSLEKSEIIVPYITVPKENTDVNFIDTDLSDKTQLKIYGIQIPIIKINHTIIDFNSVKYFDLKIEGKFPELVLSVEDSYELIGNIDKPGNDNEIRVQILPLFDNTYKKINLTFYISNIRVSGKIITLSCKYKLSDLTSSRFESFGEIDTYNLFKKIAINTKLGFASNIKYSDDKRYVYCNHKSYLDILNEEIQYSDTNNYILDYWIDYWDNINLADIKERLKTIEKDEEIEIWISGQVNEYTISGEIAPIKVPAVLVNAPVVNQSELYVKDYNIITSPGAQISKGSDKVYSIYEENKKEYLDHLLQDSDVKKDIFIKYDYIGEIYGDYNYFLSKNIRDGFIQKINTDKIVLTLNFPNLGIIKGNKVNFIRYVNNEQLENKLKNLEENKIIDRNVKTNIPLEEYEIKRDSGNGKYIIDKTVSGQYLVYSTSIKFTNKTWQYDITLIRDMKDKLNANILLEDE